VDADSFPLSAGRRAMLKGGTLMLASAALGSKPLAANESQPALRIGLVTDLHYADKPPAGTRHYRQTMAKLERAAAEFQRHSPDFVVELGDLIDAADSADTEMDYLKRINREFSQLAKQRHYVLGNHCVDTLTKEEFLGGVEQANSYYSFDQGGFHFVVLDACFRGDGTPYGRKNFTWTDTRIPEAELEWLAADLSANQKPTLVFAHQRLDVSNHHGVNNNAAVRRILETSGNVLAVFQGHSHRNDLKQIGDIHYCTLVAMVEGDGLESNGYSVLECQRDGTLSLTGFRKQSSYRWT
jgi:alkaline phosphatase